VERLRTFLQKYVDVLDPGTTIGLLAGYGRLVRGAGTAGQRLWGASAAQAGWCMSFLSAAA